MVCISTTYLYNILQHISISLHLCPSLCHAVCGPIWSLAKAEESWVAKADQKQNLRGAPEKGRPVDREKTSHLYPFREDSEPFHNPKLGDNSFEPYVLVLSV